MTKAAALFQIPEDLELFTKAQSEQILHCGATNLQELIRSGKITVVPVAGKNLITGPSLRGYVAECAANPRPSGRSLCAKTLNRDRPAKRMVRAS